MGLLAHTHTYKHTHACAYTHTNTCMLTHAQHTHIQIHALAHMHTHPHTHTCMRTLTHTLAHTHLHTHVQTHTCTKTHTHTHTCPSHTHTQRHTHSHMCTHKLMSVSIVLLIYLKTIGLSIYLSNSIYLPLYTCMCFLCPGSFLLPSLLYMPYKECQGFQLLHPAAVCG